MALSMNTREYMEADLGTAAFLVVRGHKLLGLKPDGRRYLFCFADSDGKAAEDGMEYLQGASISAMALINAEKSLKTLLYKHKNGDRNGDWNRR